MWWMVSALEVIIIMSRVVIGTFLVRIALARCGTHGFLFKACR